MSGRPRAVSDPGAQRALVSLAGMAGEGFEELLSEFTSELFGVHLLERDARTWQALLGDAGENFFVGFVVSGIVQGASGLGDAFADSGLSPREMGSYLAYSVDQELRNPTDNHDTVFQNQDSEKNYQKNYQKIDLFKDLRYNQSKTFVDDPFDDDGQLLPNVRYQTGEYNYIYETDDYGRIIWGNALSLMFTKRTSRLKHDPNSPGKRSGDHSGHLFGDRFGGSNKIDNLLSQKELVNLSNYKKLENSWARALKQGQLVTVEISVLYTGTDSRPTAFEVNYSIDAQLSTVHINNE